MDEAGFSMTLPDAYSWSPVGRRLFVPYEPPQGRRVNVVGALFFPPTRLEFATLAKAPPTTGKRKAVSYLAAGLEAEEVGTLDAEALVGFIWRIAGRPQDAAPDWKRHRPLVVVLDNYGAHKGGRFQEERDRWRAADIDLFFLPPYSPELSGIEPLWRDVKQHRMRRLSRGNLAELKRDVDRALTEKASALSSTTSQTVDA